jgi:hypothetical protein
MTELKDSSPPLEITEKTTSLRCGAAKAKLFAFGLTPTGYISVGVVPMGVLAVGIVPMGVISFGVVAMGTIATGFVSMGVAAFGGQTMGLINLGRGAVGGIEMQSQPHPHHPVILPNSQSSSQNMPYDGTKHHHH